LEISAKKSLLEKYIQHASSPREIEVLSRWINQDEQDAALQEILAASWEETHLYPSLEADVSEDIFQRVCQTTGIRNSPFPAEGKQEAFPKASYKWLLVGAGMVFLLGMAVLPRNTYKK
jgi:hypothetical protein